MTKIKFCGLCRPCDIAFANALSPAYIGFVFAKGSKRFITPETAALLKGQLAAGIQAVGVFVNERVETVAGLLNRGIIDLAQLHGEEDEAYIRQLREQTRKPLIKAIYMKTASDAQTAQGSTADYILLDAGAGTGTVFDWTWLQNMQRPYFLAGGLSPDNVGDAIKRLHPFAVDVSSGIETNGVKDNIKMAAFVAAVRKEETQ